MPSRVSQMRNEQLPQQQTQPQPRQFQIDPAYLNQLKVIMNSSNAADFLSQAMANIPQLQPIMRMIKSGGNTQVIFEQLAHSMGADPNYIINQLTH